MRKKSFFLSEAVYTYIVQHSLREHPVLRRLREETARMPNGQMQISPEQGQFLALLVHLMNARRTLEVGVFTGYSSLAVALALPSRGKITACDLNEDWTAIARKYWKRGGVEHKIKLRLGPAIQTLDRLLEKGERGKFDFAFIDADKAGLDGYYERCLKLVRRGGLIAIDNVLWSGRVYRPAAQDRDTKAIRALNTKLRNDRRVEVSMLPVADGLTLAMKK